MRFILLAALVCGCGSIAPLEADAGGRGGQVSSSTGGAGGRGGDTQEQTGGHGGGAGQLGAGGLVGAAGQGGAGGAAITYPPCGHVGALIEIASGTPHCLWNCQREVDGGLVGGELDAGASELCALSASEAAKFTNAPGPIYCWQMARGNEQPPAVCY